LFLHAPNPVHTIAIVAAALRPGGRFAVIDDVPSPDLADADEDLRDFREGWCCPAVLSRKRLIGVNRRVRPLAGASGAGDVLDGLYGGLILERLYARGLIEYRLLLARR
jgi:hypothetical protein